MKPTASNRYKGRNLASIRSNIQASIWSNIYMSIDMKGTTLDQYERSSLTKRSGQQAWNMDLHEVLATSHRCEVDRYESIGTHASSNLQIQSWISNNSNITGLNASKFSQKLAYHLNNHHDWSWLKWSQS